MSKHVGIYRISNVVNGKVYVGQGSNIYQRWRQHRHRLTKGTHDNKHLQAAWNLYGASSFEFTIVRECSFSDLGREEIAELARVPEPLRYNIGVAGDNPTLGLPRTLVSKLRQSRAKGSYPFFQKNLATGEINRFEYVFDVSSDRRTQNAINRCLSGSGGRPGRHLGFEYYRDPSFTPLTPKPKGAVEKRNRAVVGTSVANGTQVCFPYVAKVEAGGFQRTGVIKCLSGVMSTHRGFTWRYADGLPHKNMSNDARAKLRVGPRKLAGSRAIVGTSATGEIVHFSYVRAAAEALGLEPSYITLVLSGRMREVGGFSWRYADGMPHKNKKDRTKNE